MNKQTLSRIKTVPAIQKQIATTLKAARIHELFLMEQEDVLNLDGSVARIKASIEASADPAQAQSRMAALAELTKPGMAAADGANGMQN